MTSLVTNNIGMPRNIIIIAFINFHYPELFPSFRIGNFTCKPHGHPLPYTRMAKHNTMDIQNSFKVAIFNTITNQRGLITRLKPVGDASVR